MDGHKLIIDIGIAIIGAAAIGLPSYALRLPLVIAYIFAGMLLGPSIGFGIISNMENIAVLSEIGLVLLMFILGLEIDVKKLLKAGKPVFMNGIYELPRAEALGFLNPKDLRKFSSFCLR